MTFDEALKALKDAQRVTWIRSSIHDGITQALEVFKRMDADLRQARAALKECPESDWLNMLKDMEDENDGLDNC